MWRADSLEKPLMLGKIEGRRRRGWQRMRRLDGITELMDMSFSKLRETAEGREAWHAAVHGIAKSQTRLSNWTTILLLIIMANTCLAFYSVTVFQALYIYCFTQALYIYCFTYPLQRPLEINNIISPGLQMKKTEAQRTWESCPRTHNQWVAELGFTEEIQILNPYS